MNEIINVCCSDSHRSSSSVPPKFLYFGYVERGRSMREAKVRLELRSK